MNASSAGMTLVHLGHGGSALTGILLHPENPEVLKHAEGSVAVVPPGSIAVYSLARRNHRLCLFVFRAQSEGARSPSSARLPGVEPRVELLLEARSTGRMRLVKSLFRHLKRARIDPSQLSDAFYVRVSVVLGGRLPPFKVLPRLLANETHS